MIEPTAKLAYLTEPVPGTAILNLQVEGIQYARIRLTSEQLRQIVLKGTEIALCPKAPSS